VHDLHDRVVEFVQAAPAGVTIASDRLAHGGAVRDYFAPATSMGICTWRVEKNPPCNGVQQVTLCAIGRRVAVTLNGYNNVRRAWRDRFGVHR
jgi:hypothetical protein